MYILFKVYWTQHNPDSTGFDGTNVPRKKKRIGYWTVFKAKAIKRSRGSNRPGQLSPKSLTVSCVRIKDLPSLSVNPLICRIGLIHCQILIYVQAHTHTHIYKYVCVCNKVLYTDIIRARNKHMFLISNQYTWVVIRF